ncbi:hypothetical protein M404DRAFT_443006 [Pisolithus tinctorius Marx 270]|uniref:Uncharacterized protein n=1 Tax=Pisolithus tinctorius Marx 270 TaxID=870435 RepID=A0A0C3NDX3_PISTI|nr:hypothetical protein M404DRAFT_443006 [Pisolithus tinctorius Marx 270]
MNLVRSCVQRTGPDVWVAVHPIDLNYFFPQRRRPLQALRVPFVGITATRLYDFCKIARACEHHERQFHGIVKKAFVIEMIRDRPGHAWMSVSTRSSLRRISCATHRRRACNKDIRTPSMVARQVSVQQSGSL